MNEEVGRHLSNPADDNIATSRHPNAVNNYVENKCFMEYVRFGRTELTVSRMGFGGSHKSRKLSGVIRPQR